MKSIHNSKNRILKYFFNKRVYLDYAAGTPPDRASRAHSAKVLSHAWASPGSPAEEGMETKRLLASARASVAETLGVRSDEIIFTGGTTESNMLALLGTVRAWRKKYPGEVPHGIVSSIEHASVLEVARSLGEEGMHLTVLPIASDGTVHIGALRDALTPNTVIVSVMLVNNEIGTIQPIDEIASVIRAWRTKHGSMYPILHSDAAQAPTVLVLKKYMRAVDLCSFGSGKIYAPRGAGVLVRKNSIPLLPIASGGGQEGGLRSGTEAAHLNILLADALVRSVTFQPKEYDRLSLLQIFLEKELQKVFPDMHINGGGGRRVPSITSVTIPGYSHELIVRYLDARGISVATRSACGGSDEEPSPVLRALRMAERSSLPAEALRISLGRYTRKRDIVRLVRALAEIQKLIEPWQE